MEFFDGFERHLHDGPANAVVFVVDAITCVIDVATCASVNADDGDSILDWVVRVGEIGEVAGLERRRHRLQCWRALRWRLGRLLRRHQ